MASPDPIDTIGIQGRLPSDRLIGASCWAQDTIVLPTRRDSRLGIASCRLDALSNKCDGSRTSRTGGNGRTNAIRAGAETQVGLGRECLAPQVRQPSYGCGYPEYRGVRLPGALEFLRT